MKYEQYFCGNSLYSPFLWTVCLVPLGGQLRGSGCIAEEGQGTGGQAFSAVSPSLSLLFILKSLYFSLEN
jgi:hypothetical protein